MYDGPKVEKRETGPLLRETLWAEGLVQPKTLEQINGGKIALNQWYMGENDFSPRIGFHSPSQN